jgi:hypothetical protein
MALKWLKSTVIYPGGIIVKTFSIDLDNINLLEGATRHDELGIRIYRRIGRYSVFDWLW